MSVLCIPGAQTVCILCVCVCVLKMRHWFGGSYNKDPDPYSQKAYYRWERRSWISDQAPLVHKILLKGKTQKDQPQNCTAATAAAAAAALKDIQRNKVNRRRQRERSVEIWHIPGWWSKADLDRVLKSSQHCVCTHALVSTACVGRFCRLIGTATNQKLIFLLFSFTF